LTTYGYGDAVWTNLWVLYPQKGIILGYPTLGKKPLWQKELTPEAPVHSIMYFDSSKYQDFFKLGLFGTDGWTEDEINKSIHPWSGYGSIKNKYPSVFMK
jgi:hypothetical protein